MKEFIIEENEAGQRFDKYLAKLLREAPKSFFYKMLRKKNITLNGKKATGNEKLLKGDTIKLFLSDETFDKFAGSSQAARAYCELDIVYEDPDIIIINKPAGMLSQPADDGEPSLVEYLTGYLLKKGDLTEEQLKDPDAILDRMREAGVVGMGGAMFPTAFKIRGGIGKVDKLIINCDVCLPFLIV